MSIYGDYIKSVIRTVPDWPQAGVNFRDITPLLQNSAAFRKLIDSFVHRYQELEVDAVAAIDARGFIIGAPLAYELGCSFVPVRKKGKLPFKTISETYSLEYGESSVELHSDAFQKGDRIVVMDDLIATGGTMLAAAKLIQRSGGHVVETATIVDLPELGGSEKIRQSGHNVFAVCSFLENE
ncbi:MULTISPECIES: adenine phosphoribosyltransferase [Larsenimonas]|uniref:Adenine phosphoribosyltransferase n=1 Tax=Larsenimonas suaedae TaxID=1851019 RepID=A0ABU1GXV8_9GAMM|nr:MULTISPECIES: adenine phosphoribosyltransferase [Larsenimonas]MCM2971573.1 adenine phosphoribosyltransferase [Larsenimonas suaedae]MCM5703680.1 adenine phosphoribosyltransferase [Larsenimonas salina]MDR5896829.1 adenine phosphoribosyltransferase [Larsenimonas suaedae]